MWQAKSHLQISDAQNRYAGLLCIGVGMTSRIFRIDPERAVKVAKRFTLSDFPGKDLAYVEFLNDDYRQALKNERRIYERIGTHDGVVQCYESSDDGGIVLAYAEQGDLENFITTHAAPNDATRKDWILSIIDTLSFIHSRRVLVDEIALRNILVLSGKLKYMDFGQSILLEESIDMDSVCHTDLTTRIEILHLGWIIYSIADWDVHKYYYFDAEELHWPTAEELPSTDHLVWGMIIRKCWEGAYRKVEDLCEDARRLVDNRS